MGPGRDRTCDPRICSQTPICCHTHYRLRYAARYSSSMTPSLLPYCVPGRWDFSFGNRWKSEGAISGEYGPLWGMRKDFKSTSVEAVMATCDVVAGVLYCKSRTAPISFPRLFLAFSWRSLLNRPAKYAPFIMQPCFVL